MIDKIKQYFYRKLPRIDRYGLDYTMSELNGMSKNINVLIDNWHGKRMSEDFKEFKKSDTIFILGSGPSINNITDSEWEIINEHDSIGFNYWLVHDFVPSMFAYQGVDNAMCNALKENIGRYRGIPFILRGADIANGRFNYEDERLDLLRENPVFYLNTYPISSKSDVDIPTLFQFMKNLGIFSFDHVASLTPKFRSSIGLLSAFAYQMGYKKIVLCGVDMNDSRHFWDDDKYEDVVAKYNLPSVKDTNLSSFTDKDYSRNTVPAYLIGLHHWMLANGNVELQVMSKQTVLFPNIPVFRK